MHVRLHQNIFQNHKNSPDYTLTFRVGAIAGKRGLSRTQRINGYNCARTQVKAIRHPARESASHSEDLQKRKRSKETIRIEEARHHNL